MPLEAELQASEAYSPLQRMRYFAALVMAAAVQEMFPGARFGSGRAIEDGFYYDFELHRPLTPGDFPEIEQRMQRIIAGKYPFVRDHWSRLRALEYFRSKGQLYKVELIENLSEEQVSAYQQQNDFPELCRVQEGGSWPGEVMICQQQLFLDLCSGQLVEHTGQIGPIKLMSVGGAYWRGDQEISTPLLNDKQIWEISGHWEHFCEDMFLLPVGENQVYGLKPMNCPNAMILFNIKIRSYRDLPLRLADFSILHRHERAGTLHGLLRAQKFQQDDAHIFLMEDQIEDEFQRIFEIADLFYKIFDMKYTLRLGTRPEGYIGDLETWNKAEAVLRSILDKYAGQGNYIVKEGDGAFYGPKADILIEDALGRSWQLGTIQLDFQLPRRFNCSYIDKDGQEKTPVVIHRAICGSLERFIGILIEHTAGAFPVWIAPVQVRLIPIADRHIAYAQQVMEHLRSQGKPRQDPLDAYLLYPLD